jgi:outer membrane protein OmpA-like peptidoglycan-associated protein
VAVNFSTCASKKCLADVFQFNCKRAKDFGKRQFHLDVSGCFIKQSLYHDDQKNFYIIYVFFVKKLLCFIINAYFCRMNMQTMKRKTHIVIKIFILTALFSCAFTGVYAQKVSVSNNLLYDGTLTPNLRVGYRLAPHWSVGMTAGYRSWSTDDASTRKLRHLLLSPSVRYWTDSVSVHHFFGTNLIYSHYNVGGITFPFGLYKSVRNERRQGDLVALGIFYGYSWPLGRFLNLEAMIGAALGYTSFDRFECAHCGQLLGHEKKLFAMPQAALNIVFNIPGRPAKTQPAKEPVVAVVPPVTEEPQQELFEPIVRAVPDFTGRAGQLQKENPVLAHVSQYKPYDRTRIMRRDKDALYVHFPLAKSELHTDFRENESVLGRIVDITRQIMADTTSSLKVIQIVGLASIEGPIAGNEKLATNRALALQHYVQEQLQIPDSLFDTVGGGEAWAEFRDQLEECVTKEPQHSEELQQAINIIDSESDANVREQKLRRMNGGRTWKYIKEHILIDQRNSGYVRIYYDYVPDEAAQVINEASQLLTTDCSDCHHKALRLLLTVRNDERAQNALGTAYWLCGQQQEALECFRQAATRGNADAQENFRRLEKVMK